MIRGKQFGSGQYELNTESTKDEATCRAVKGPDDRPLRDALDSSPSHHRRVMQMEAINKEGRHVGPDFYDLLIEGDSAQNPRRSQ